MCPQSGTLFVIPKEHFHNFRIADEENYTRLTLAFGDKSLPPSAERLFSDIRIITPSDELRALLGYMCARMRRGFLYDAARNLGCNKIALGHHYDDVIETTLMNMLNSGSFQTMLPKLHSDNFDNMELIRPIYLIREKDIINFSKAHNLEFIRCACRFTENIENNKDHDTNSQRYQTKLLIEKLKDYCEDVEQHIFTSALNVNMDMILGYKKDGVKHTFLEDYDNKKNKKS